MRKRLKSFTAAIEGFYRGIALNFSMRSAASLKAAALEYAWLLEKLSEARRWRRGRIKGFLKCDPLLGVQPEFLAMRQSLFRPR